jgi:hypothetical protein
MAPLTGVAVLAIWESAPLLIVLLALPESLARRRESRHIFRGGTMRTFVINAFLAGMFGAGLVFVVVGVLVFGDGPYTGPKWLVYTMSGGTLGTGWWAAEWAKTRFAAKEAVEWAKTRFAPEGKA